MKDQFIYSTMNAMAYDGHKTVIRRPRVQIKTQKNI